MAPDALARELERGAALHRGGRLQEALAAYRRVSRQHRKAWQPLHLLGIVHYQLGELEPARAMLERAAQLAPEVADVWYYLGETAHAAGNSDEAERCLRRAIDLGCSVPVAAVRLAELADARSDWKQAEAAYRRAAALQPDSAEICNNLGNVLRKAGKMAEARAFLELSLTLKPALAEARINLGLLLHSAGDLEAALRQLEEALRLDPSSIEARFARAGALADAGRLEEAAQQYGEVLARDEGQARAWNNLGVIYLDAGFRAEARRCFERALGANPQLAEACNNLGNLESRQERHAAARNWFERAISLRPSFADAYNGLGMAHWEEGGSAAAQACFQQALALNPANALAAANLGMVHQRDGDTEQARAWYRRALASQPSGALEIRAATIVPPIMFSSTQIAEERARLAAALERLLEAPPATDEADLLRYPDTPFFLAYHGENDRALLTRFAQVYARACPTLSATLCSTAAAPGKPLRIGFVSRFFYNHSVGNFFNPIIAHLARRAEFDLRLFSVGYKRDAMLEQVATACTEHVVIDPHSLSAGRQAIAQRELDILVYADIGMDPYTYLLAFSRLAPIQCVLQGHSDTTGIPSIDYFISSALIEPSNAQALYSERLVLLDTMPMYLQPFECRLPGLDRAALGLPDDAPVYLCPMRLQKVHPDMDALVAGILERDRRGRVFFFNDQHASQWGERLQARIRSSVGHHADRVAFLPFQRDRLRFLGLLAAADVMLDTPHHGGGTTCNMCLSAGTPIVSLVGATCRGRGPLSYYGMMGIDAGLSGTPQEYVDWAVNIAADRQLRAHLSASIRQNLHRLQRNDDVVQAYARLFQQLPRWHRGDAAS
jgi:predicted O-linked N-acetylglucosamine transferase (SPINDLY family)